MSRIRKGKRVLPDSHYTKLLKMFSGVKRSKAVVERISLGQKESPKAKEHLAKLHQARKGAVVTDECRARISATLKARYAAGYKLSDEARVKLSQAMRLIRAKGR